METDTHHKAAGGGGGALSGPLPANAAAEPGAPAAGAGRFPAQKAKPNMEGAHEARTKKKEHSQARSDRLKAIRAGMAAGNAAAGAAEPEAEDDTDDESAGQRRRTSGHDVLRASECGILDRNKGQAVTPEGSRCIASLFCAKLKRTHGDLEWFDPARDEWMRMGDLAQEVADDLGYSADTVKKVIKHLVDQGTLYATNTSTRGRGSPLYPSSDARTADYPDLQDLWNKFIREQHKEGRRVVAAHCLTHVREKHAGRFEWLTEGNIHDTLSKLGFRWAIVKRGTNLFFEKGSHISHVYLYALRLDFIKREEEAGRAEVYHQDESFLHQLEGAKFSLAPTDEVYAALNIAKGRGRMVIIVAFVSTSRGFTIKLKDVTTEPGLVYPFLEGKLNPGQLIMWLAPINRDGKKCTDYHKVVDGDAFLDIMTSFLTWIVENKTDDKDVYLQLDGATSHTMMDTATGSLGRKEALELLAKCGITQLTITRDMSKFDTKGRQLLQPKPAEPVTELGDDGVEDIVGAEDEHGANEGDVETLQAAAAADVAEGDVTVTNVTLPGAAAIEIDLDFRERMRNLYRHADSDDEAPAAAATGAEAPAAAGQAAAAPAAAKGRKRKEPGGDAAPPKPRAPRAPQVPAWKEGDPEDARYKTFTISIADALAKNGGPLSPYKEEVLELLPKLLETTVEGRKALYPKFYQAVAMAQAQLNEKFKGKPRVPRIFVHFQPANSPMLNACDNGVWPDVKNAMAGKFHTDMKPREIVDGVSKILVGGDGRGKDGSWNWVPDPATGKSTAAVKTDARCCEELLKLLRDHHPAFTSLIDISEGVGRFKWAATHPDPALRGQQLTTLAHEVAASLDPLHDDHYKLRDGVVKRMTDDALERLLAKKMGGAAAAK